MRIWIETLEGLENIKPRTWYVDSEDGELKNKSGTIVNGSWTRGRQYPYRSVTLTTAEGKKTHKRKCRIIALALVPGRTNERNIVDHINGRHDDDRPENLRWVTQAENMIFLAYRTKTERKRVKPRAQLIGQISMFK